MKQTNKLKMIAAMAVSVAIALFTNSCSNDEFYGFEHEYDYDNNYTSSFIHNNNLVFTEYLDITSTNHKTMVENDFETINKAIIRIELLCDVDSINKQFKRDLNMSDSLFHLASRIINNTRNFHVSFNSGKIKRNKNNNREGFIISGHDCVGQAIAYKFSFSADSINSILANKYPNYYSKGIPYKKLEEAFDECDISYSKGTSIDGVNSYNILIIKPVGSTDYHAMNIISSGYSFSYLKYYIHALDKNNDWVEFLLDGNSLPRTCSSPLGFSVDKYYTVSKDTTNAK